MTDTKIDRETWLARASVRSPETEQAIFGGDVGEASDLTLDEINPLNDPWDHDRTARRRSDTRVH